MLFISLSASWKEIEMTNTACCILQNFLQFLLSNNLIIVQYNMSQLQISKWLFDNTISEILVTLRSPVEIVLRFIFLCYHLIYSANNLLYFWLCL